MSPVQEGRALEHAAHAQRDHQPSTYAVVREWHNEHHPGAFDYCDQQPLPRGGARESAAAMMVQVEAASTDSRRASLAAR